MKYQELAQIIRREIKEGEFRSSHKLPTEAELREKYNVSRYCVRNAIDVLIKLGLVYPVQGSGMYIRESKREGCLSLNNTRGITDELAGKKVVTKVESLELVEADEQLAARMKCEIGTPIYAIKRKRFVEGTPLSVEYTYYDQTLIPHIDEKIASGSLFRYIRENLGLSIAFADKVVSAEKLPKEAADWMGLEEGDPAIVIEDDVYLANGQMFNASKVYYNYKEARFFELAEI